MSKAAILLRSTRGVDAGKSKKKKKKKKKKLLKLVIIFYKVTIRWFEYFNNVLKVRQLWITFVFFISLVILGFESS